MQGAKYAISKLMYGLSVCTDDNRSLKLVAYRPVHTDEPYIKFNLHLEPDTLEFGRQGSIIFRLKRNLKINFEV